MAQLDVDIVGDEELRRSLAGLVPALKKRALQAGAQAAFDSAQASAGAHTRPGGSGALERSVRMQQRGEGYVVGHDNQMAPHAVFVHWGTRPHKIPATNRKALRFPYNPASGRPPPRGGGRFEFYKWVQHPGYEGDPYMFDARDAAKAAIIEFANRIDLDDLQ